jgi:hypothetical protein
MLIALGHPNVVLKLNVANTTLNIIAFIVGVNFGIQMVALASMLRGLIMFPVGLIILKINTQISFMVLSRNLLGPAFSASLMVLTVLAVSNLTVNLSVSLQLLIKIITGGLVYFISLLLIDRPVIVRVFHLLGVVKNKSVG